MAIARIFLGWERPGLASAVEYLESRFGAPGALNLSRVVLAVPGGRAQRRLLEMLVQRAEDARRTLDPPKKIITVGGLPELLYQAKRPFAEDLVQQLAWVEALRRSDPRKLAPLLPVLPAEDDREGRLALAEMLSRLHRELAADALDCQSVADCGSRIPGFREQERWQVLWGLQQRYLQVLDELELWDLQTARLFAIRHAECRIDAELLLVGTVDLNQAQRLMLDQVAERVTALVFAPEEAGDRFDEHGCLRPERWQDAPIPLADERVEVADSPADQAAAAVRAMAALGGRYSAEEITLGVPDERLVPDLQQQLRQCGARARYGVGTPVVRLGPCRFLAAVADYLEGQRFPAFAALVRHPAVGDWLAVQGIRGDWLRQLDEYHGEHLPYRLSGPWLGPDNAYGALKRVRKEVDDVVRPLRGAAHRLDHWAEPVLGLLAAVYGQSPLSADIPAQRAILDACDAIRGAAEGLASVPEPLMPSITGADALRLVLRQVEGATVAPPADRQAVELLGWLELPLDDAPAMIVTGMNEGIVPSSLNADLFLPDQLRRALGIEDNLRRYARDAYTLTVITASRRPWRLIAGRRTAEGDPLAPSRLLFACEDERIVRRTLSFFSVGESRGGLKRLGALRPGREQSAFEPPQPRPLAEPVTSMRVTEFRDYLACPYRYYLRHRLGLGALDDAAEELDGAAFGSLVHAVLCRFGTGPAAASANAEEIAAWLNQALDQVVAEQYGENPRAAVRVQVEQSRVRLAAFARWQADWVQEGWQIRHVEAAPEEASLMVDGQPMRLRGRIDRIDFQPSTGAWMVFDYKTSDTARTPEEVHRDGDTWVDLQLPLYRHLVARLGVGKPLRLAYILLPKDVSKTGEKVAEWDAAALDEADAVAADVIRGVRKETFGPPVSPPPPFFEEFGPICLDDQFRPEPTETADEEGTEAE